MKPPPPSLPDPLSAEDSELLSCIIAAPTQEVAAEWLQCSSKHLRHRLKVLRDQLNLETNEQLIVLASVRGWIDPGKVLPFDMLA